MSIQMEDCLLSYKTALMAVGAAAAYYIIRWFLWQLTVGDYDRKYVFVTGCDSGFGKLLAKRLDSLGFHVFAGCLTEKGVTDLQTGSSGRFKAILLDVTKSEDIAMAVKIVKENIPPGTGLWSLVNNAGISGPLGFPDCFTRKHYEQVLDVNMYGVIDMTNAFLPLLREAHGRIINVASVLGRISIRTCIPYTISKHAVEAYSDGLRRSLRSQKVSVHILEPGLFKTELFNLDLIMKNIYKDFDAVPAETQEYYGRKCLKDFTWVVKLMGFASSQFHKVVNSHVHAITAKYPKYRYLVGYDAHCYFWPLMYLPEWISDFCLDIEFVPPAGAQKKKNN